MSTPSACSWFHTPTSNSTRTKMPSWPSPCIPSYPRPSQCSFPRH
jgi:hypothetical protein